MSDRAWEREWERAEKRGASGVLASCPLCLSKILVPAGAVLVRCGGRGNLHRYRRAT